MSGEKAFVRVTLSLFALLVALFLLPFLLLIKVVEGVQFDWSVTAEVIRQIWASKGTEAFDRLSRPD